MKLFNSSYDGVLYSVYRGIPVSTAHDSSRAIIGLGGSQHGDANRRNICSHRRCSRRIRVHCVSLRRQTPNWSVAVRIEPLPFNIHQTCVPRRPDCAFGCRLVRWRTVRCVVSILALCPSQGKARMILTISAAARGRTANRDPSLADRERDIPTIRFSGSLAEAFDGEGSYLQLYGSVGVHG